MKRAETALSTVVPYLLILLVAGLRLTVQHPANFIPIFSVLLYFGAVRRRRETIVPLIGLIAVDAFLTTQHYGYALSVDHAVTWIWYGAALLLGGALLSQASPWRAAATSLSTAVGFFVVSNFAVWALWQMYPRTGSGLVACYVAALPFFRNSAIAEVLSSVALFALAGIGRTQPSLARAHGVCQ